MPLYGIKCLRGHESEQFVHHAADFGCRTVLCGECGCSMSRVLSVGRGLCWLEESRPLTVNHFTTHPVTVRSYEEHKRMMKKYQVEWATEGQGRKGCWV